MKDMMPTNNTTPVINKSPSCYECCRCTTRPADYYYVSTGKNPKSPTEMIPLCDLCYQHQYQQHHHNRRRRNNRR